MSFQAYLDNIKAQTGKTPEDFRNIAQERGLLEPGVKTMDIVNWLKDDFGLGRGHAMAIVNTFKHAANPGVTNDDRIDKLFTGTRGVWRLTYDDLLHNLQVFGSDVRPAATDSYVSLIRGNKKFGIVQVTGTRMDIGIKLKSAEPTDRFKPAGDWNAMVTHRVAITDPNGVDAEVLSWLKQAYDLAK